MTAHPADPVAPSDRPHRREMPPASPASGLGTLLRLTLRLARRRLIWWTLAVAVLVPSSVIAIQEAYPDQAALDARAALLGSPSAVIMTGPAFAQDQYTLWAMVANELLLYVLLPAAILGVLLTVSLTRGEEEAGRLELLRSLPVGRSVPALAAFAVVLLAALLVGTATAGGLIAAGGAVPDSFAVGAAVGLTTLVFAAVAAVIAQVTEHAGTASGASLGVLALAFLVRGVGDVLDPQGSWLSWLSPLAWAQQTRVYVDLRWWPLLLCLGLTLLLGAVAAVLGRRRDLGAGLLAARSGRATAPALLLAPGGLVRRLLGRSLIAWGIGLFLFAVAFGSLASSLEDLAADIPELTTYAPLDLDNLTTSFSAYLLMMLAIGPLALAVWGILRLGAEEREGRLAALLLSGTSRTAVVGGWVAVVLGASALLQMLLGLGLGLGVWTATSETHWVGDLVLASLAYLPAIALAASVALLLYGRRLRLAGLAWLLVGWCALDTMLGTLLDLPDVVRGLNPLFHVPLVPDAEWEAGPAAALLGVAVLLGAAGLLALRRRDLVAG